MPRNLLYYVFRPHAPFLPPSCPFLPLAATFLPFSATFRPLLLLSYIENHKKFKNRCPKIFLTKFLHRKARKNRKSMSENFSGEFFTSESKKKPKIDVQKFFWRNFYIGKHEKTENRCPKSLFAKFIHRKSKKEPKSMPQIHYCFRMQEKI